MKLVNRYYIKPKTMEFLIQAGIDPRTFFAAKMIEEIGEVDMLEGLGHRLYVENINITSWFNCRFLDVNETSEGRPIDSYLIEAYFGPSVTKGQALQFVDDLINKRHQLNAECCDGPVGPETDWYIKD